MDVLFITEFQTADFGTVAQELQRLDDTSNRFVHYRQVKEFEIYLDGSLPINLDGEPQRWDHIRFEIRPQCLPVVLPADCPVITGS